MLLQSNRRKQIRERSNSFSLCGSDNHVKNTKKLWVSCPKINTKGKTPRKDFVMKTAIITRTLTTSTVSAFDLVRKGWFIQSNINGTITATKQQVCNFKHPELASWRMEEHNIYSSNAKCGLDLITKIDFGPCKVGVIWNNTICRAEAWMHRPEVKLEDVIPKEDEEYISQEDIDYDNACFDADMRDFEDLAQRY